MTEKPKIQYIGQFYTQGSAAKKLEIRRQLRLPGRVLPLFRPNNVPVRYVDPVAIISIVLAVALVVTMVFGMLQIQEDWREYEQMNQHLDKLRSSNAQLRREYRKAYDLETVQSKALGLGLVPVESVKQITVRVTPAYREEVPELTWVQELTLFWTNLWE